MIAGRPSFKLHLLGQLNKYFSYQCSVERMREKYYIQIYHVSISYEQLAVMCWLETKLGKPMEYWPRINSAEMKEIRVDWKQL